MKTDYRLKALIDIVKKIEGMKPFPKVDVTKTVFKATATKLRSQ